MTDLGERLARALQGRYALERQLGAGGMATVFLARDVKHDRPVAVKLLRPEIAAVLGVERFLSEIRVTARLQHPHILPLFDSGEADGLVFYVMPYVAGETLRERLTREKQLPIDEAIEITRAVASALEHAHRQGIVHRDIKPENILLQEGQAVVADFGIALALSAAGGARLTETGLSLGTPEYMSPEQAMGDRRVDARTDVYSLGCVLYEMLVADPPHTGSTAQAVITKVLAEPPQPIRRFRETVPVHLEAAVMRALAKVPADRFATVAEFAEALTDPSRMAAVGAARQFRRVALWGAAAVALVVVGGLLSGIRRVRSARPAIQSIAVLPLANISLDSGQAYLADGLTDLLITNLARSTNLRVTSRMSTLRYRREPKPAPEVARELNVELLVEGTVVREGGRVRINAQLIRAGSDEHVWANTFERDFSDVLALEREVAQAIADQIGVKLAPWQAVASGRRSDPQAQEEYLRGVYHYGLGDMMKSAEALERAVLLDSDHALAYAALARSYYFIAFFGDLPPRDAFQRMEGAASKAVEKDPSLASAHGSLALVRLHRDWKWDDAEQHFRRAIELNPSNPDIHHDYAHFLLVMRRDGESVAETERAVALDPFNPMLNACLGWHRLFAGQYDEAISAAHRALRIQPANFWARLNLGWAYEQKSMFGEAVQEFRLASEQRSMGDMMPPAAAPAEPPRGERAMGKPMGGAMPKPTMAPMQPPMEERMGGGAMPPPAMAPMQQAMSAEASRIQATRADLVVLAVASLGHALALAGDRPAARTVLDRLLQQQQRGYVSPYDIALVYAGLGDKDQALEWLQRAYQERSSLLVFALREPRIAPLRSDPRFAALARQFSLPQ
ncbi:MAG: protein kinase [Gemmatimonadetes bacterium]|nr:protein kinase [Gemmatimonadota bacterium]